MRGLPPERGNSAIWLLSTGLMVLAAAAVILTFLVLQPSAKGRFQVALEPIACPAGVHTPVCYQATATNVGNAASAMKCIITPGSGSQAMFPNNEGAYISPNSIAPGGQITMQIKVDAPSGGTVTEPFVACVGV